MLGYNLRLTEVQAAVGLVQLRKVDGWTARRQANAAYLSDRLRGCDGIVSPSVRPGAVHVYHQYTLRVCEREVMMAHLAERGVAGAGVHDPQPIHQQPLYRELGYLDSLPHAEQASREVLSLPVHPALTAADLDCIAESVAAAPWLVRSQA